MRPLLFSLIFMFFSFSSYSQTIDSLAKKAVQNEYKIIKIGHEPNFLRAKKGANILDEPSETGKIIVKLEEAKPILQIFSITEEYFQVCLEKECGYLTFQSVELNPESEIYKVGRENRQEKILQQGI